MTTQSVDVRPETRALGRSVTAALARHKRRYQGTWLRALVLL